MDLIRKLYEATNFGLDIICHYFPEAAKSVDHKKPFALRNEKTPSAYCRLFTDKDNERVYKVTDFGDDARAISPIDICCRETGKSFKEALYYLCDYFRVDIGYNAATNKPDITKRDAEQSEEEGAFVYKVKETIPLLDLSEIFPNATTENADRLREVCHKYFFYSLEFYEKTKDRKTTRVAATNDYPIFMRDCGAFRKIYQPCNPEKRFRFFYDGTKPADYINGLEQLIEAKIKYENSKTDADGRLPRGEDGKLPEAILCSGERDALNVAAMGYCPVWLNSETAALDFWQIAKYTKKLINIPDIDSTGVMKGKENALQHMELYTLWLPEKLRHYRDRRGRPRKDLRDYIELYPSKFDFGKLLTQAMPCQFWQAVPVKDYVRNEINTEYLLHFLWCCGFGTIESKTDKGNLKFVRIVNNIVHEVTIPDVKLFIRDFLIERNVSIEIRNLMINSNRITESLFTLMRRFSPDFVDFGHDHQYLYFKNKVWELRPGETIVHDWKTVNKQVWNEEVIPHNVNRLAPSFCIQSPTEIEINHIDSYYFRYLICTSRVHWRKELETNIETHPNPVEYLEKHRYDIAGELLPLADRIEQMQHLINKIFAIGYLLHRYKTPERAWCVFAMDNFIGENGESNGRSGKSFCFRSLRPFMRTVTLPGRNKKLTDTGFTFDRVDQFTKMIIVDDAAQYLDFNFFFDSITGDMVVNPKSFASFEIPFEQSPKLVFTSNYTIKADPSTEGRILYTVFSDWFHQATDENNYRQTRTIADEFGCALFDKQYSPDRWNADLNFFADCLQFYLTTIGKSTKINPPMTNVKIRTLKQTIGENFIDWAASYFAPDSDHIDTLVSKAAAFEDCLRVTNLKGFTAHSFSRKLALFAELSPWLKCMNPENLRNASGRIQRKENGTVIDYIYMQSERGTPPSTKWEQQSLEWHDLTAEDNKPTHFDL